MWITDQLVVFFIKLHYTWFPILFLELIWFFRTSLSWIPFNCRETGEARWIKEKITVPSWGNRWCLLSSSFTNFFLFPFSPLDFISFRTIFEVSVIFDSKFSLRTWNRRIARWIEEKITKLQSRCALSNNWLQQFVIFRFRSSRYVFPKYENWLLLFS